MRNISLLESDAKILKSSKVIGQSHYNGCGKILPTL